MHQHSQSAKINDLNLQKGADLLSLLFMDETVVKVSLADRLF